MGFGGSVSAMISSLKSNNNLRRKRVRFKMMAKHLKTENLNQVPLSHEENRRIIEENKKLLNLKTRNKRIFGLIMLVFYASIAIYGIYIFKN